ncbi:MAG: acetyl-CoA carboxylase biotin carboxyl carrier protein [Leptolyngbyaceae cyanobacterium]
MSTVTLDLNQLRELLTAINETDIAELTLKSDEFELTIRRGIRTDQPAVITMPSLQTVASQTGSTVSPLSTAAPTATIPAGSVESPFPGPTATHAAPPPPSDRGKLAEITSPMVGTFYRSPAPDEPPFVDVGDRIRKGQTVCIIEAMKLMNELEAEISGELIEILVQNGEPIEFGQPLMRVKPE